MDFEWDAEKAASNYKKHGIRFEYALAVFDDVARFERPDFDSSDSELRWLAIGLVESSELTVITTERENRPESFQRERRRQMSEESIGKTVYYSHDPANPYRLTPEERDRLNAIRDEDIDLTDIPEQSGLTKWNRPGLFGGEARDLLTDAATTKTLLVLEADVVDLFKENGDARPERMNAVLREYAEAHRKSA